MPNGDFTVYKHTSPTGKVYIGITRQTPENRFQNGEGYRSSPVFYAAIQKHGWESFRHEILLEGLTEDAACAVERELIKKYRSQDRRFGYNIEAGGRTPEKLSEWTRRHQSETFRRHMQEEEFRRSITERNRKIAAKHAKPVVCTDTGKIYESVKTAARDCAVDFRNLMRVLQGKRPRVGGLHFEWQEGENNGSF